MRLIPLLLAFSLAIPVFAQQMFQPRHRLQDVPRFDDVAPDYGAARYRFSERAEGRYKPTDQPVKFWNITPRPTPGRAYDDPQYRLYWENYWREDLVADAQAAQVAQEVRPADAPAPLCVECGERLLQITDEPMVWNEISYVSTRDYFIALGTQAWYDATLNSAVAALPDGRWVGLPLSQKFVYVNRERKELLYPTALVDGKLMVPVRALSEVLGVAVRWEAETRSIILTVPWGVVAVPTPQPEQ